jgi:hypothetical protein
MVDPSPCDGCTAAADYSRSMHGARVHCDECGATLTATRKATKRGRNRRDDENAVQSKIWEMVRELELLARWLPTIEGGSSEFSPIIGDGNRGGGARTQVTDRTDWVNDHHEQLWAAQLVHRRLLAIGAEPAYALAHRVMWIIVRECGSARLWALQRSDGQFIQATLVELIGHGLATSQQRRAWRLAVEARDTGVARAGSAEMGDGPLCAATAVWFGLL